jgi:hypothetical protein
MRIRLYHHAVAPFLLFCLFSFSSIVHAQHEHTTTTPVATDTLKKSIPKEVHAQLGTAHHMVHYYSPAVRGRSIWGGLVPFGEVWVTGAHRATTWEFDKSVELNGQQVPAGKYGFFTIPGKKKWIIILNKKWDQHLADDYSAAEDVIRIEISPKSVKQHQERLAYYLTSEKQNKAALTVRWEKLLVKVPFTLVE